MELMSEIKNIEFFKQYGIAGRDLLDVCEFLTYEYIDFGKTFVDFGEEKDSLYIVLDGKVNFVVDMGRHFLQDPQVDEICQDLEIVKKKLVKRMCEFKDRTGLNE